MVVKPNNSKQRKRSEKWGRMAEIIAILYLMAKGYHFIQRRVQTPYGELDLIMRHRQTLILVEVKARITIDEALNALSMRQIERMKTGFTWWLGNQYQKQSDKSDQLIDQRVDFIAIARFSWPRHIKNITN